VLAQQGFPIIYNNLIALAAAITPRKLVRFKGGQKLPKSWTFWGDFGVFLAKTGADL
jgi:hypothetical protein